VSNIKILYIGSAVPDTKENLAIKGMNLAGHYAELGIVEGLADAGACIEVLSFRPYTYFPKEKVFFRSGGRQNLCKNVESHMAPLVNLYPVRNIIRYLYYTIYLLCWTLRNLRAKRIVIVYNWLFPNYIFLRLVTYLLDAKLCPVVMDWLPMECNKLGTMQRLTYPMWYRKLSVKAMNLSDAMFPITENIIYDNFHRMPYLLIDGGVTEIITSKLFPIKEKTDNNHFIILFAGSISVINNIKVLLEYMEENKDEDLELWFAGKGDTLDEVLAASAKDARIKYLGMLSADDLFMRYEQADIVTSLRDTNDPALRYYFPSKTLELLCIGKPFITTNSAHIKREYGSYCQVLDDCTAKAFGAAVEKIRKLTPSKRMKYGERARDFMLTEHTWKAQGGRMLSFLRKEFD